MMKNTENALNYETYEEPIGRYRLFRNDNMLGERAVRVRAEGIDPEKSWHLIWSFHSAEAAETKLAKENARSGAYSVWKLVDAGEFAPKTITRVDW